MKPCEAKPDCYHQTCTDCDRPIRYMGALIADHPGTVVGLVKTRQCDKHRKAKLPKQYIPKNQEDQLRHENNVAGLNRFLRRIRGKSRV